MDEELHQNLVSKRSGPPQSGAKKMLALLPNTVALPSPLPR